MNTSSESIPLAPFDFTTLDGPKLLDVLRDNAANWAAAFNQHAVKLGYSEMDEGWLITWFANAIEHSHDVRHGVERPPVLPDGSSFFTGTVGKRQRHET